MPETTPLIKAALNLRVGAGFDVYKQTDSEQEALYKLRCRIISCKIAKELYVRGIKSDIVDGWKRISENKNEFIEIRNVVFDTTGDE